MAHSIVKVTESQGNDSLLLVIGEDGIITPDKETVQSYLNNRPGATELQVMHMNKTDGKNIDITLDTLTYIHSEEIIEGEEDSDMDELQRNLNSFRMDHDYTPLTSPKRQSPSPTQTETIDELAHTLSLLEGSAEDPIKARPKPPMKTRKVPSLTLNKQKAKMITTSQPQQVNKQPKQVPVINKIIKKNKTQIQDEEDEGESEEHFDEEEDDDDNDSDFELDEKPKLIKKGTRGRKSTEAISKVGRRTYRSHASKELPKSEPESPKIEKTEKETETKPLEVKQSDKKQSKKEKKVPKPPDDFALFSTPDIIRRVGGKEPQTPTTPTTPETPKSIKPAKISMESRSKSSDAKKRLSVDQKRISSDEKTRRSSLDKPNKLERPPEKKGEGRVTVQGYDESLGSSSSESMMDSQLEPLPSAEDIRSIIQNENTKSFTTSLIIPDPDMESNDQNQLESGGLELDQSILDNINTDLISEDILYQVAQSLAENPDLQNVIDKSIVDGNLILDTSLQNLNEEQSLQSNQQTQSNNVQPATSSVADSSSNSTVKGTQIIRPDGRVLVLPPIERPTTRSRNRRGADNQEVRQVTRPVKPLDDQHVSGNELDSSEDEEEESEDDPNKLWCICNQPHNNRFMICCDTCEEWYHGKCVNVTKAMGQMMEQEGKEWICVYCKDHSLKRPSAAARRVRKASRASRTSTDSASSQRKSTSTLSESAKTPACIVCRKSSRSNSIYCSDECILKHAQGVEKVVVFERRTGKTLSGSSAPSAANLEKWLKEHPGYEVARPKPKKMMQSKLQLVKNSANEGVSLAVNKKGVSIGVLQHSPKQEQGLKPKAITGVKILNKNASASPQKTVKLIQPVPITRPQSTTTNTATSTKPKILNPGVRQQTTPPPKEKAVMKTPKARQAEVGQQPKTESVRDNVRKTLMEQLMNRLKMCDDLKLTPTEVTNISNDIESQLYKCFGDTGQKYRTKYRSLIFNIKDIKNQTLWRRICEKAINPYQLVRLSHDDLASQELALWRQREAKHQLDMIEKSELELLNCNRQYVFKTHKGEQVFEDDRPKDQTVTEVITALNNEAEKDDGKKESSKDKDKKGSSKKRERSRDRKSSKEKSDSKERRKDHRSSSRDRDKDRSRDKERDRKKRSRSRDRSRHSDKHRSRSRDRDRHRKSSHKSSRHKKNEPTTTETKLDKKSKEILEQLVDKQIVPPLEDRLWKHVPQEDVVAGNPESDSDHEPSSTVTIPTPPRNSESDEPQSTPTITTVATEKAEKKKPTKSSSMESVESISPKTETIESRPALETVWTGTINMVDVAQISITAHEVSGDCNGLNEELPSSLDIVGRITPETVWDYIGKMKCLHSKMISLLRLNATNMEEKMPYIALYSYLSSRNRLGVVKTINKAVKDFYILPLGSNDPIPQALLPINGAGFEENRPPLLVGIIVRDKRKRPMLDSITNAVLNKKSKLDSSVTSPTVKARSATPPIPPTTRSYTPPPSRDPRLKPVYNTSTSLPTPPATSTADEDEPYSPEDSDPEATTPPLPSTDSSTKSTTQAPVTTTPVIKSNPSFLSSQTFKPFSNKFDDIPGLDLQDSNTLPASTQELQRKMAELDQRIAMQQAEIQNMSQDIVCSASATGSDIGSSALANIALPNNLQQILESIKIIGAQTRTETDSTAAKSVSSPQQDLTIPLMLPKISSRTNQKVEVSSPTIPLNLPKIKGNKQSINNSPQQATETDKSTSSVLSSLSEEDLIRKAAEMLGETETPTKKQKRNEPEKEIPPPPIYAPSPSLFSQPPPIIGAPPQAQNMSPLQHKRSRDMSQPPIPGLEDEC